MLLERLTFMADAPKALDVTGLFVVPLVGRPKPELKSGDLELKLN